MCLAHHLAIPIRFVAGRKPGLPASIKIKPKPDPVPVVFVPAAAMDDEPAVYSTVAAPVSKPPPAWAEGASPEPFRMDAAADAQAEEESPVYSTVAAPVTVGTAAPGRIAELVAAAGEPLMHVPCER